MLSLGYGCGLRAGEVIRLKVKHIDRAQKIIRIEQSKGRKDRNVMLSAETLDLLRHANPRLVPAKLLHANRNAHGKLTVGERAIPPNQFDSSTAFSTKRRTRPGSGRA